MAISISTHSTLWMIMTSNSESHAVSWQSWIINCQYIIFILFPRSLYFAILYTFMVSRVGTVLQYQQLSAAGYSKHDLMFMVHAFWSTEITDNTCSYRDWKRIIHDVLKKDVISTDWNIRSWLVAMEQCNQTSFDGVVDIRGQYLKKKESYLLQIR